MKRFVLALALLAGTLGAVDYAAEGDRWWSHVLYLADDKLEGRDTGTPGHRLAAEYVATQFERAGLKAAGTQGYFQPVQLLSRKIDEAHSSLSLIEGGKVDPLKLGEDAMLGMRGDPAPKLEADAVFVGYGISIPERHYDDLAGLDLHGKVAVFFYSAPKSIPGPLAAHLAGERWKTLREAGAIGAAYFPDPKHMDIPWSRMSLSRFNPAVSFTETDLNDNVRGMQLSVTINPEHAAKWFAGTGHTAAEIIEAAEADKPLPRFPLKVKVRAEISFTQASITSDNVAGIVAGADPKLKDEYVVISAHLDHVGVGQPINGDRIYNGAMDNAAGTASLIELAKMAASGPPLKRSILFVAVTGEEKGLLGSKYFAAHPTVKPEQIIANVNVDMFLPLFPLKSLTVYGLDESTLGDLCQEVGKEMGIRTVADREPERNIFIRSDQYNFIRHGVPAVFFKFDADPGTPEDQALKTWLKERYHGPADDTAQPVDKAAAARFDRYVLTVADRIADAPARPQWKTPSFFRRFAKGS
jgi:hypothetical protein